MARTDARVIPAKSPTDGVVAAGCLACAHPWTVHDQIATRFCQATVAGRYSRSCICTVRPGNA